MLTRNHIVKLYIFFVVSLVVQLPIKGCEDYTVDIISNCSNCVGSDIHLSAVTKGGNPPYTYSWTGPNGFTATSQTVTIIGATDANLGKYTVKVTDAKCIKEKSKEIK